MATSIRGQTTESPKKLAEMIINGEIQLPHFQRPYVWSKKKRAELFKSIFEGYSIGAILLWEWTKEKGTHNPFDLGRTDLKQCARPLHLVVDGQQRLTTLTQQFLLAERELDSWHGFDGRNIQALVIDIAQNRPGDKLNWVSPKEASEKFDNGYVKGSKVMLAGLLNKRFDRVVIEHLKKSTWKRRAERIRSKILDLNVLLDWLPKNIKVEQAVCAFTRINSGGVRIGVVDIAAANLFEIFPDLSGELVKFHNEIILGKSKEPEFGAVTRDALIMSLLFKVYGKANPSEATKKHGGNKATKSEVTSKWKQVKKQYKALREFLELDMHCDNSDCLETLYLVVAAEILGDEPKAADRYRLAGWLIRSLISLPYTGGATKSKLDDDLKIVAGGGDKMWQELDRKMERNTSRAITPDTELQITIFKSARTDKPVSRTSILTHALWLTAHNEGAVDWESAVPLPATPKGSQQVRWDRHHLVPKHHMNNKALKGHRNRVGNLTWLTKDTNRNKIRKRHPSKYLPEMLRTKWGEAALLAQGVPVDKPVLFTDPIKLIDEREKVLCAQLSRLLKSYSEGKAPRFEKPAANPENSADALLKESHHRETDWLEFKETFVWNATSNEKSDPLRLAALKTIASFANMGGGTLLIGVDREGKVVGIEQEEKALAHCEPKNAKRKAPPELDQDLRAFVKSKTWPTGRHSLAHPDLLSIKREMIGKKAVLVVRVKQSPHVVLASFPKYGESQGPVWVRFERHGASSDGKCFNKLPTGLIPRDSD